MFINISKSAITLLLMVAIGITTAALDIYIASLPYMVTYFKTTPEMVQLSVPASIIGSSIMTLFVGPLSDAIGRRRLIVFGQLLFGVFNIMASFSPNIEFLIMCRYLSGSVSCTTFVLGFAVISDIYSREETSIHYTYITSTILLSLIIAPLIGGYFADIHRWDYSFLFLGLTAVVSATSLSLTLPETLKQKRPFSMKSSLCTYRHMLSNTRFVILTLVPTIWISAVMSFFTNGSFYYIEELNMSAWQYSKHQIFIMSCNCLFSFFAGRMIKRYGIHRPAIIGMTFAVMGGLSFTLTTLISPTLPLTLTIPMAMLASGTGLTFSSLASLAMQEFPDSPGTSSALISLVRGIGISIIISLSGIIYYDKAVELGFIIFTLTITAVSLYLLAQQKLQVPS